MGYEYDSGQGSSIFAGLSGKKLAALAILLIIGAFFAVQALFGFPIKDLFRKEITDEAKVVIKDQQGTCVVEGSDSQPRSIPNCQYKVGDTIVVTFKEGTAPIEKHHLKLN
jgi:hypothetical protein